MSVQHVVDNLHELNKVHQVLLELAGEKRQVLVQNEVERLNQIVHEENKWLQRVQDLEKERLEAIGQVLMQRGYHPNPRITVSDLIRLIFKAEDKKALMEAQHVLQATLTQLRERNALNRQLIEQSLAFIDYSLNLMVGMREDETMYQRPGTAAVKPGRSGMFDTRA